jgi:hypothetical protein
MQFANPGILWFLAALIIPIIIHLFYFRRYKKVYFSDTRFLHEAKEVQKNASRLKHLLVLLSRLLAMSALILAFAQPFMSADEKNADEANHISFFIDNSFSMEAGGRQQSLLEEAKSIAVKSLNEYPDHYSFHVFDHSFAAADQQWIDKEKAINKVRRTSLTGAVKTMSQIVGRQRQMRERLEDLPMNAYVFTDGQENIFSSLPDFEANESVQIVRLNPVLVSNLSVDSVWLDDPVILPGQASKLYVRLSNFGNNAVKDIGLSFTSDGQSRPAGSFDLPSGQSAIDTIPITFSSAGWKELRLSVEDESIRFDDELLMTLAVTDMVNVLLIDDNNHEAFFRAAVQGNKRTVFERRRVQNLIYSDFKKYDLIIIDGLASVSSGLATEINNYVRSGGNALFFPKNDGDVTSYNAMLLLLEANTLNNLKQEDIAVQNINTSSYIFKNVYRQTGKNLKTPEIKKYYSVSNQVVSGRERLLDLRNRDPYLIGYRKEGGNFYLCTAPSDEASSNILSSGSFFVPMLHRMSISSKSGIAPYYTIGDQAPMTVSSTSNAADPVYKLVGNTEVIPARYQRLRNINLYAGDQIDQAGFYRLTTQDSMIAKIAFNFNRSESDMNSLSDKQITQLNPDHITILNTQEEVDIATALVNKSANTNYWRWCLILALGFLFVEQVLLRHLK